MLGVATALVVFLAPAPSASVAAESNAFETQLASIPQLSVGILSATQGSYSNAQMVLDMTQGARVSPSAYSTPNPPQLFLPAAEVRAEAMLAPGQHPQRFPGQGPKAGQVRPWAAVLSRARSAPQLLSPGLLAAQIPGGAAYLPTGGVGPTDGALAANHSGLVAEVDGGLGERISDIRRALSRRRLVVADLSTGAPGLAELRTLAAERPAGELLIVLQRTPEGPPARAALVQGGGGTQSRSPANGLLWVGIAGLRGGPLGSQGSETLTSQTTNEHGIVAAIDMPPTILRHLGLSVPAEMRGKPLRLDGSLDGAYLRSLKARLGVVSGRRLPALGWLLLSWALLLLAARLSEAAGGWRRERAATSSLEGPRARVRARARHPPQRTYLPSRGTLPPQRGNRPRQAWALRVGGLALLWAPVGVLVTAALEPARGPEFALLVLVCFALAALSDRLLGWPRALMAPALVGVLAIAGDALAGTQLLMRSLLGPNPAFGARFYGVGNELKSGLAVLVLCAVAAALYPAVRGRRAALAMGCAGVVLAVVEGSARIGAGVGGVILVSAGTAVACAMLLPGELTRRRVLLVLAAPVVGLVGLAALDLATAHGGGHFTGSVLDARSAGDLRDVLVRRYGAAWDELRNHLMPLATALALGAGVLAVRHREGVCSPVNGDPVWVAALCGSFAAGLIGALSEDSGPVLLVVAMGALGCVLAYVWGTPPQTSAGRGPACDAPPVRAPPCAGAHSRA